MPDEEYEEIPWQQLLAADRGRRRRWPLVAAVVAVGLAAVVWVSRSPTPATPEPTTSVPAAPATTTTSTSPPAAVVVAEEDLAARGASFAAGLVSLRAETFVTDYFTVDGDPDAVDRIHAALAAGVDVPPLPHEVASSASSYVEWVDAYQVVPVDPHRWSVTVAFQTVYERDEAWHRAPIRAVFLPVVMDDAGGTAIADLPMPIAEPLRPSVLTAETPIGDPPADALADATDYARRFSPSAVVGPPAGDDRGWRAGIVLEGPSGISWPLVVRSELLP